MQRVILAVVVLAACGRGDTATESLRGSGPFVARMEVPRAAAKASQAHLDRLRGALLRRDPAGTAGVWGRERSHGDIQSAAFVFLIEHAAAYTDGATLSQVAADMRAAFDSEAKERGISASMEDTTGERHIDVAMSIAIGTTETRMRARLFIADRLYEVGCQCMGEMCSGLATCVLPDPPPGALPVDQAFRVGSP